MPAGLVVAWDDTMAKSNHITRSTVSGLSSRMNRAALSSLSRRVFSFLGVVVLGGSLTFAQPPSRARRRARPRSDNAPKVGVDAPSFKLEMRKGDGQVELASFKGEKPVVLVFGSYT